MIRKLFQRNRRPAPLRSYAQCGEDILAHNILCRQLRIERPTYLDIGANDPVKFSNTYLLYTLGFRGLLIEPDPDLARALSRKRPGDVVLQAGINIDGACEATLYRMNQPTLNTFSKADADEACAQGPYRIEEEVTVPMLSAAEAIRGHLGGRPNFVSLDAEGLDLAILERFDFEADRPELVCVETVDFCETNLGRPRTEVYALLAARGYFAHSRSHINGLFVCERAWAARFGAPPPAMPMGADRFTQGTDSPGPMREVA